MRSELEPENLVQKLYRKIRRSNYEKQNVKFFSVNEDCEFVFTNVYDKPINRIG